MNYMEQGTDPIQDHKKALALVQNLDSRYFAKHGNQTTLLTLAAFVVMQTYVK